MRRHSRSGTKLKRRTTLTLPRESLAAAERIARSRNVTLSTVIAEVVEEGLRSKNSGRRAEQIVESYQRAFAGFTDKDLFALDGIILEERSVK